MSSIFARRRRGSSRGSAHLGDVGESGSLTDGGRHATAGKQQLQGGLGQAQAPLQSCPHGCQDVVAAHQGLGDLYPDLQGWQR